MSIIAYPNFLDDIPDVNVYSDLRFKFVKYSANPYIHKPEIDRYIESPVIIWEIMDVLTNQLEINISDNLNKSRSAMFEITIPYIPFKGYD